MDESLEQSLRATLRGERGLTGEFCHSDELFALERERVFGRSWVCVGLADDVPRHGAAHPTTMLNLPLLLVRQHSQLRVFHNVCSHRGALIVDTPCRGLVRLVCPYHSWSYALDGRLLVTPNVAGVGAHTYPDWDIQELALREVRSAVWAGHVFIDLSGQAPAFQDWIRPVEERLGKFDWHRSVRDPALATSLDVAANWKLIVENFVESYHLPRVHENLNAVNPMEQHYQILGGHSYLGQGGSAYEGERAYGESLPPFESMLGRRAYDALFIFPNLILGPLPDFAFSIVIEPVCAGRCRERIEYLFAGDAAMAAEYTAARRARSDFLLSVNREDIQIVESVQRGRRSPAFTGGRFSPAQELTSLQFQQTVAACLLTPAGGDPRTLIDLPFRDIYQPGQVIQTE